MIHAPPLSFFREFPFPLSEETVSVPLDLAKEADSHELAYDRLSKTVTIHVICCQVVLDIL